MSQNFSHRKNSLNIQIVCNKGKKRKKNTLEEQKGIKEEKERQARKKTRRLIIKIINPRKKHFFPEKNPLTITRYVFEWCACHNENKKSIIKNRDYICKSKNSAITKNSL